MPDRRQRRRAGGADGAAEARREPRTPPRRAAPVLAGGRGCVLAAVSSCCSSPRSAAPTPGRRRSTSSAAPTSDVAIYRGVNTEFGPLKFFTVYKLIDLKVADLNPSVRSQVRRRHHRRQRDRGREHRRQPAARSSCRCARRSRRRRRPASGSPSVSGSAGAVGVGVHVAVERDLRHRGRRPHDGGRARDAAAGTTQACDAVDRQGRDRLRGTRTPPSGAPAARAPPPGRAPGRPAPRPLARHLGRPRDRLVAAAVGRRAVAVAEQDGVPPMTQVFNPPLRIPSRRNTELRAARLRGADRPSPPRPRSRPRATGTCRRAWRPTPRCRWSSGSSRTWSSARSPATPTRCCCRSCVLLNGLGLVMIHRLDLGLKTQARAERRHLRRRAGPDTGGVDGARRGAVRGDPARRPRPPRAAALRLHPRPGRRVPADAARGAARPLQRGQRRAHLDPRRRASRCSPASSPRSC